jgi:hypothetical protein
MSNWINEESWLFENETPPAAGGPPSMSQPGVPGDPMASPPAQQGGPAPQAVDPQPEDLSNDPQHPEMPEQEDSKDFESFKIDYVKESIKGDPNILEQMVLKIRDLDLEPNQLKFVEDNLQICGLRQHQDYLVPSQKIRKLIKDQLDRSYPAGNLVTYIADTLDESPLLNQIYIKLLGDFDGRQGHHRKFISALLGAVQVAGGPRNPIGSSNEDLVYEEKEFSIRISTRFVVRWGDVNLGAWMMNENDPERYLKPPELERLDAGSPEEKDVLRRRIVMESIAKMFNERAFIINTVGRDGTIMHLGLDLGNCLKSAYTDGKLVVRTNASDSQDAFIDQEGAIVPIPDLSIYYVKESQELNDKGRPEMEELEFITHKNGMLYLKATGDLIKEAANSLQGFVYREVPWQGTPDDLKRIRRCTPTAYEVLMKDCNG